MSLNGLTPEEHRQLQEEARRKKRRERYEPTLKELLTGTVLNSYMRLEKKKLEEFD